MDQLGVVTGIDLPAGHPGGSMILLEDLYRSGSRFDATVFTLPADTAEAWAPHPLVVPATKALDGVAFWDWTFAIRDALRAELANTAFHVDVVHCQHLAFGMTPALIRALPDRPRIGLVHGTDLLFAAAHRTQRDVLDDAVLHMDAVVVPTAAMADWLTRLASDSRGRRIEHIPWGVPDRLLKNPAPPRRREGPLRLLFAGRLTREKGAAALIAACSGIEDLHVAVVGPEADYTRLCEQLSADGTTVEYRGWLDRESLWTTFDSFDALAVPSTTLEAFCLTAIEAQARGLPVIYQPVPGLAEVLGDSALPVNLADPTELRGAVTTLAADAGALTDLRTAGLANAARFPLSATAAALAELSFDVADSPMKALHA